MNSEQEHRFAAVQTLGTKPGNFFIQTHAKPKRYTGIMLKVLKDVKGG